MTARPASRNVTPVSKNITPVRITSGEFRGRKLKSPSIAHPMGDREKLALFNTLGPLKGDESVLDCYCGSGALGLEALSRGAQSAKFVDRDALAVRENVAALDLGNRCEVRRVTLVGGLPKFSDEENFGKENERQDPEHFDLIFIDPPYGNYKIEEFINIENNLKNGGTLVLSHPDTIDPTKIFSILKLQKTKTFARCNLSFFTK